MNEYLLLGSMLVAFLVVFINVLDIKQMIKQQKIQQKRLQNADMENKCNQQRTLLEMSTKVEEIYKISKKDIKEKEQKIELNNALAKATTKMWKDYEEKLSGCE